MHTSSAVYRITTALTINAIAARGQDGNELFERFLDTTRAPYGVCGARATVKREKRQVSSPTSCMYVRYGWCVAEGACSLRTASTARGVHQGT